MFTPKQRYDILKWGSLTLLTLCIFATMMHGLFFVALFHYYIPAVIIGGALYFGYTRAKTINLTDDQIKVFFESKYTTLLRK